MTWPLTRTRIPNESITARFDELYEAFDRRDIDAVLAMMNDAGDCRTLGRAAA